MPEIPFISRARLHGGRIAIRVDGIDHTYSELLEASAAVATALLANGSDLAEARIAFQAPAGFNYLAMQWGIWRAGGVCVPLSVSATPSEVAHVLGDSGASQLLAMTSALDGFDAPGDFADLRQIAFESIDFKNVIDLPEVALTRRAMILFTSGTTSKPKGVVTTHANIQAQVELLVDAWEWSAEDRIPLFLPMHHVHGIINVASCALWSGAAIEAFAKFEMDDILRRVAAGAYSVFMAVPTIYVKLIEALESNRFSAELRGAILCGFGEMRLMVSGSAALPASVHEQWAALTGQRLLERYGMTETGMMISNPLHGERRAGSVGLPLPTVELRLKSETGDRITQENEPGEIQVRGPVVFREYWNAPEITAQSFDDGWFRTGDLAVIESGYYRIMGRLSIDIIKSGGYKLSALEIEATLLEHPAIRECAVVGIKDETWGEVVAVAAVLTEDSRGLELDALRDWSKGRLSPYKMPRKLLLVRSLPRNAMGKVTKKLVAASFGEAHPAA